MDTMIRDYQALQERMKGILSNYSHVKDHLFIRMRNRERCIEELTGVVYRDYLEFAVTCHIDLGEVENDMVNTAVTHEMLDRLKVSEDQLWKDALRQSPTIRPPKTVTIRKMLRNLMKKQGRELDLMMDSQTPPMMVLTTEDNLFGACVVMYPGLLQNLAQEMGGNLLLIPSSEHEFLAILDEGIVDTNDAEAMIREVNQNFLLGRQKNILSNHLYGYDRKADQVYLAQDKRD